MLQADIYIYIYNMIIYIHTYIRDVLSGIQLTKMLFVIQIAKTFSWLLRSFSCFSSKRGSDIGQDMGQEALKWVDISPSIRDMKMSWSHARWIHIISPHRNCQTWCDC